MGKFGHKQIKCLAVDHPVGYLQSQEDNLGFVNPGPVLHPVGTSILLHPEIKCLSL